MGSVACQIGPVADRVRPLGVAANGESMGRALCKQGKHRSMLGPETCDTVAKLRARIESAEFESRDGASTQQGSAYSAPPFEGKVWLRFEWEGAAAFYYCCETEESQFTKPEDAGHISDILIMTEEFKR